MPLTDQPPLEPYALATWFAEGVRSELSALEKDGGSQNYEVLSGQLIEATGPMQAIFQFIIADGTLVPEDATGRLKTGSDEYAASVISQNANLIQLHLEGMTPVPPGIPRGMLIIDDTALLRKLAEVLEEAAKNPTSIGPLAATVFHPAHAKVGYSPLPEIATLVKITGEMRRVLEQACGSSITYIWGPPGTGKTFGIAHLIAALIEKGERVLVTSHTHAAVNQALYEAVKNEPNKEPGPLSSHQAVIDGKVLRIGRTADQKIPHNVRLDGVMESRAGDLEIQISELEAKAKPLSERRAILRTGISEWEKFSELTNRLQSAYKRAEQSEAKRLKVELAINKCNDLINERQQQLEKAQRSWFRRAAKTERATQGLLSAGEELRNTKATLVSAMQEIENTQHLTIRLEEAFTKQRILCEGLLAQNELETEASNLTAELDRIEGKIREFQEEISNLEQKLISGAQAIFCTLTKIYIGKELEDQKFDAIIADEISMALPPLLFLAASRAISRVILVGDFLQLPPIVRSDSEISDARLKKDTFQLAGVADGPKPAEGCPVLTRLTTQRRMLPPIADVARHLAYGPDGIVDHAMVRERLVPTWLGFLPPNPLLILDTADLHCWSGKQPGSLSRFNFYSATVSVELAAMAAANIPEPALGDPPPIGIVTPFTAQRRLLVRLIEETKLVRWVAAGTVHTFQGGQADLIIFDSVLDEPYWSARLCTPRNAKEVKRDLNVAVTRAKNKFIFIGSSQWLNSHANQASGLGQMWSFFKDRADLVSATEFVEFGFPQRVSDHSLDPNGWRLPHQAEGPVHEILDETNFYERFATDINSSSKSIFGLAPYFGEYRWPRIQPMFSAALARGVEVTLVTPPLSEAEKPEYVEKAIRNLRDQGAVVISASGLHGKDIILDERIHYTGSLNWASSRGRMEIMHRTDSPALARLVLKYLQAKHIRSAAVHEDGQPRVCPNCGCPTQVVNQRQQHGLWDFQAMKVGCANSECRNYLRNIDERPPLRDVPLCQVDGRTRYRRVRRGRGEIWQCPKHPKECEAKKVVPGDPE